MSLLICQAHDTKIVWGGLSEFGTVSSYHQGGVPQSLP